MTGGLVSRRRRLRGILLLLLGLVVLVVAAWMVTRGIQTSGAPLLDLWQRFWAWASKVSPPTAPRSPWVYAVPIIWLMIGSVAFLTGWAVILSAVNLLWRRSHQNGPVN